MPEFILDRGTPEASRTFRQLDEFTQGYIECAFFTECGHGTNRGDHDPETQSSLPGDASFAELAPEALADMVQDCKVFQANHAEQLETACAFDFYSMARAGHDFWLTRNHHGAGFWDRGLGDVGDTLTKHAHAYGECSLYTGDDGLIYA